jgi:hypothetical protein
VSGTENHNAIRLRHAEQRLARAIDRLDAALQNASSSAQAPDPQLSEALSRLQSENAELRTMVGQASERLDGTIAKLKTQLAS